MNYQYRHSDVIGMGALHEFKEEIHYHYLQFLGFIHSFGFHSSRFKGILHVSTKFINCATFMEEIMSKLRLSIFLHY